MFDYPAIRKFYFDKGAEKCASDPSGEGRFESAFYHTIKMVHDSVSAENAARIAVLEADIKTLCAALSTTSEGNAQLLQQRDELLAALKRASESLGRFVSDEGWGISDMECMDNADAIIAKVEAA